MKNQKITNKKSEANPYNISPEEINLDLTKLQEERLKLLSEISKGQFVNTDLSYFYDLMRFYVDNATVESKKITTEFDGSDSDLSGFELVRPLKRSRGGGV